DGVVGGSMVWWEAVAAGAPVDGIASGGAEVTGESRDAITAAVDRFCPSLVEQGLIVERADIDGAPAFDLSGAGSGLLEPSFETYADMQDLILLDPVHEVGEGSWPNVQTVG